MSISCACVCVCLCLTRKGCVSPLFFVLAPRFQDNYRSYRTSSFKQANKEDAKATKGGQGSGSGEKAYASTTRSVITACTV